jgi:ABC-2 type transport system ATP-binding protein
VTLAIEAHQLTKRYHNQKANRPALDRLDLDIPSGHLYGLVGPDGSGKTTALRILTSAMPPTSGSARIAGFDILRQADKARPHIGYMPQAFSLYPDLSVIENLNFFADINGMPKARRKGRIAELLEFSRLTDFQSRRSEHLSGGMRKKLALACALIHEPQVLLLDEPTTGVDPVSRRELWRLLSEVVQRGVTVLMSTPYMDEAERCNTVGVLYEGRLLVGGSPAELEAQLPFQVVEVKARPRGQTRDIVSSAQGVLGWRPVGDRLRLSVSDPQQMQAHLAAELEQAGASVSILRQARPTMEDVFVHMAEKRRGEA